MTGRRLPGRPAVPVTWVLVLAACRPAPEPGPTPAAEAPVWRGYVAEHWLPGPHRGQQPADPGREALEAGCRSCHADVAHEWQASEHAGAWSSAAFQAAFAREPLPFCQACHAPEVPSRAEVPDWAAAIGVGCVTCHVEPGGDTVWATRPNPAAPHPVASSPAFAGPQACARCHEFEFPDARIRERPLLMQSTVREHAASAFADRSCADCHMPPVAPEPGVSANEARRSHAFVGAYSPEMLAKAVRVTTSRTPERIRVRLDPGEVGHAVPTGDLLRRLELRVEVVGEDGGATLLGRRWFGRRFGPIPQRDGVTVRGELDDTRVGPAGVEVELVVPAAARARPLRWVLVHQRVAHAGVDPTQARLEGWLEFASGTLAPQ